MSSDIGEGTINLLSQLADKGYGLNTSDLAGKTDDELNTLFINARIQKFRMDAPAYWDIDDCLFFMNNVEFNAGTDERAKNTYPYCFGTETSRWRWRVDDADTRFDTTNRGLPDKEYSVETHDTDETGASVWNGETNNFFNLMELAFPEEKIASMRKSMTAMQTLGGLKSGNDLEKLFAFYQKYYFDQAQEYFPANAYNADAKYCYENGKLAYNKGHYSNDTDPITQSLGDHYLAEQRWITKRILYMMSKYSFGLFSANGTDTITVRAAGNTIKYELTPAMDMYPAIANGTSIIRGRRTKAGEVCEMEIELSGSGDQQNAIQGASYLQDIGDWHNKNVTGSMIIQGRMLRDIRLGSKDAPVVISISSLTLSNCVSLQRLLLSNIATLAGTLNLSACSHLQEIYADGTSLTQIVLPSGGGLRVIQYGRLNQYLSLSNYPLLTTEGIEIDLCRDVITDFFIVNCPNLSPMQLLVDIMNAQTGQGDNHSLKRIRAVGFEETYNDSGMLDKLATLADGSYEGLSSEGIAGEDKYPVLDGILNIEANHYADSIEALRNTFKKLVLNVTGKEYVRFKDSVIGSLIIDKYGDGEGVTMGQIQTVRSLDVSFRGNSDITSFNEFMYFASVTNTNRFFFENCINLRSVKLPESLKIIDTNSFYNTAIEDIYIPASVERIYSGSFNKCKQLQVVTFSAGNLYELQNSTFRDSGIKSIILPDTITEMVGGYVFYGCSSLETVHYPVNENITEISASQFCECSSLIEINISEYITSIGQSCFRLCKSMKEIEITDNIHTLGKGAFFQCESLENLHIPSSITSIPDELVRRCYNLTHLDIPEGVTSLGIYAIAECTNMEYIIMNPVVPPTIVDLTFNNTPCKFYVPDGSLEAYKTAGIWSKYASRIYPLSQKTE